MKNFTKLSKQILNLIKESQHILLHLHPSPDGDSVGSTLSMYHYLSSIGKDVHLIKGDSELKQKMSFMPGYDKIEQMNYFEVDLNRFDLMIILDSQDLSRISKLGDITFPPNLKTINIDHHPENTAFADINFIDPLATSTSENIFKLLTDWKVTVSQDVAVCLYIGIIDDTKSFYNINTTADSFTIVGKLARINPQFINYLHAFQNNNSSEEIKFVGLALNSLKEYFNGKVAISSLSYKILLKNNINGLSSKKTWVSEYLRSNPKWLITIALSESEPKVSGMSLRSADPKWDVSLVAKATGEGGGHPVASGATIYKSAPQALKDLLKAIQSTYPELGDP